MIINSQLGGKKPTGTKSITSNGVHDVADYASADVQVPTTAPAYYVEKKVVNGKLESSSKNIISFSGVTDIGNYALNYAYGDVSSGTINLDMSSVTSMSGQYACSQMFGGGTVIRSVVKSVNLSNLVSITGTYALSTFVKGQSALTGTLDLHSLTSVAANALYYAFNSTGISSVNLSGLVTVNNNNCFERAFSDCNSLTSVNLSGLQTASGQNSFLRFVENCHALTSADFSSLKTISGQRAFNYAFYNSSIPSLTFNALETLTGQQAFQLSFQSCTSLTSISFNTLSNMSGNGVFTQAFVGCTSLANIYFGGLKSTSFGSQVNQFSSMLTNVTGCTIHFPSNLDPQGGSTVISSLTGYPNFGGTNTVLSFDLPATE